MLLSPSSIIWYWWRSSTKKVTAGLAEIKGAYHWIDNLSPAGWLHRDQDQLLSSGPNALIEYWITCTFFTMKKTIKISSLLSMNLSCCLDSQKYTKTMKTMIVSWEAGWVSASVAIDRKRVPTGTFRSSDGPVRSGPMTVRSGRSRRRPTTWQLAPN